MKPTEYFISARLLPAIICSAPFFVLYFFFLRIHLADFFEAFLKVNWLGDASTALSFIFLMTVLGRAIAKDIF